jgi:hypothetical protein
MPEEIGTASASVAPHARTAAPCLVADGDAPRDQLRGKAVVGDFLGDIRPEVWVSDRLAAQMGWATTDHQVCLAHLLRDT